MGAVSWFRTAAATPTACNALLATGTAMLSKCSSGSLMNPYICRPRELEFFLQYKLSKKARNGSPRARSRALSR